MTRLTVLCDAGKMRCEKLSKVKEFNQMISWLLDNVVCIDCTASKTVCTKASFHTLFTCLKVESFSFIVCPTVKNVRMISLKMPRHSNQPRNPKNKIQQVDVQKLYPVRSGFCFPCWCYRGVRGGLSPNLGSGN